VNYAGWFNELEVQSRLHHNQSLTRSLSRLEGKTNIEEVVLIVIDIDNRWAVINREAETFRDFSALLTREVKFLLNL
jgi:hypothetical protein